MPLVYEAFDWPHGTYVGATMSSEKTAAAAGRVGELRFDPMAMLPFCGYHMGDYWQHWLDVGRACQARLPRIFHVNWFRKSHDGRFLWPGFGQNLRVLAWIADRCRDEGDVAETPIGLLPCLDEIDFAAAGVSKFAARQLLTIDPAEWLDEVARRADWLDKFGERLPAELRRANEATRRRVQVRRVAVAS